jgi:O-antigen/teichoic acid export membrane protein
MYKFKAIDKRKLLSGSLVILLARVCGYALSFFRNMILARSLAKADFGLAVMFGATVSFLEVASRMAFGNQTVQAKEGGLCGFQATAHTFQFVLSLGTAALMFCSGGFLAQVLKVPQHTLAFSLLGVIPLFRACEHLDIFRQQRHFKFWPAAIYEVVPQTIITIAAWPLAIWLKDHRVILWLMIARAMLCLIVTHLVARRPYRWAWKAIYVKRMWCFGWPLLLTSIIIFAAQQADQIVVGAVYSLDDLASYALAVSVVSIPWFILGQSASSIMLPLLSRFQGDPQKFLEHYKICLELVAIIALVCTIPLVLGGGQIIRLFYGGKYSGEGIITAICGSAVAIRFLRYCPALASLARGDTINELCTNCVRALSLPGAFLVANKGGSVAAVACCGIIGEFVSMIVAISRLSSRQGVSIRVAIVPTVFVLVWVFPSLFIASTFSSCWNLWIAIEIGLFSIAAIIGSAFFTFPQSSQIWKNQLVSKIKPQDARKSR